MAISNASNQSIPRTDAGNKPEADHPEGYDVIEPGDYVFSNLSWRRQGVVLDVMPVTIGDVDMTAARVTLAMTGDVTIMPENEIADFQKSEAWFDALQESDHPTHGKAVQS
jgi:hypothetical protein